MGGPGGHVPPQVLGYQLTLFGPRGQIMPAILLPCPPIILDDAAFLKIILFLFRAPRSHKPSVEGLPLIRIEHGKFLHEQNFTNEWLVW